MVVTGEVVHFLSSEKEESVKCPPVLCVSYTMNKSVSEVYSNLIHMM